MSRERVVPPDVIERVIEQIDDGVALVDRSGTIRLCTGRFAALFGHGPRDLIGRPIEALVPPDVVADHAAARERFVHEGRTRPMTAPGYDIEGLRADGSRLPIDVQLTPLDDELLLVAVRDATQERTKAAELALARADLASVRRREQAQAATLDVVVQHVFGAAALLHAMRHLTPAVLLDDLDRAVAALHDALDLAAGPAPVYGRRQPAL